MIKTAPSVLKQLKLALLTMVYLGFTLPVLGHEFWLHPLDYQPKIGTTLHVELRNGEDFEGVEIGYFPKRIERFEWLQNQIATAVNSKSGDFPVVSMTLKQDGLMLLSYETKFRVVQYGSLSKFLDFAAKKGFANPEPRHRQFKISTGRFNVIYTRFCKSLIGVGTAIGKDHKTRSELEFIAMANPYTDDLSNGIAVKLLYRGQPQPNTQIKVFARGPDDVVTTIIQHSNAQGIVTIVTKPAHSYLLDAALLREPNETFGAQNNAVWETLWVSMTFSTP